MTVAYLLFRVADTLEDATRLSRDEKLEELARFQHLLAHASAAEATALAARWHAHPPMEHAGYEELLAELPSLVDTALRLDPAAWRLIAQHTARTTGRMAAFVGRTGEEGMALRDLADLRDYCYAVAGIVGELLTELFLVAEPALEREAGALRRDAAAFGEALQLVNILKDSADDSQEGRHFLPAGVQRGSIFALAHRDLDTAARYCGTLEAAGASAGLLGFSTLPVLLARATLAVVEREGPGAKVSRDDVARQLAGLQAAIATGGVRQLLALPRSAV